MFFRLIFGLPGAAFVTGFLFVAMAWMIRQDAIVDPPVETPKIDITANLELTDPKKIIPPPRKQIETPPPIKMEFPPARIPGPTPTDPIRIPEPGDDGRIVLPPAMQPTVKIAPAYPDNCRARGAQGVVIVEFDVTAEGEVVNPRIVSSANSCLDRTVLNTIQKWKYTPKQDASGRPVMQRGVREFFNFQLTEE